MQAATATPTSARRSSFARTTLFKITKFGVAKAANIKDYNSAMPVYESVLTDAEIVAVLSWIKAQWPPAIRKQQDGVNRSLHGGM